ncbi:hypothetical protein PR048_025885 [Dryococelus australis]|uniref:Uncharacterized protein n=1 Tax=Dryococelus australis TaxID=614101 RepID=A0ABQ9GJS8_9NEOP|nr:hypothetical protein PR048_025885 [Dryococelus australis]
MNKFVYKKPRVELTKNVTSLSDAASYIPSLALSASSASVSSQSQTFVANCDKLLGKSKGRTFQKPWTTSFSWVEWDDSSDKVVCKTCKKAEANGILKCSTKKDDTFISVGFSYWKKAIEKFRSHEKTETHKEGLMKLASSSKVLQYN